MSWLVHQTTGTRYHLILLATLLLLTLTACSGTPNAVDPTPPTIHYGEDICEFCGMITSEERFAAAYVTSDGHSHIFDDISDMFLAHLKMQEEVVAFFVHDYEDKSWIRAETAHYTLSDRLTTPMASGLAAFTSAEKATALAEELGGEVLTFDELMDHYQENSPAQQHSHSANHY
jgi:copper chaperone NosL